MTVGFVCALVVAGTVAGVGSASRAHHRFSHVYPPDPRSFERPKVTDPAPRASAATTVRGPIRLTSLASIAYLLPHGTLVRRGHGTWRLTAPVDLTRGAVLATSGGTLELAPGTFLQARAGGSLELVGMTVLAVNADGTPAARATPDRAFLAARDGGKLVLRRDRIRDLGHLGTVAYGISLRAPAPGSAVSASSIDGNFFGIFLSHAAGVSIVGNTVSRAVVYGIDPFGGSHDDLIAHNLVERPGLHGIVLARGVTRIRVVGNRVRDATAHGIVLFDGAHANTIVGNSVAHAFDGIVVTDSSSNRVLRNSVSRVARFGLRVSGASHGNLFVANAFGGALVGAYFYGGASGNVLRDSVFGVNRENVRVRADAAPVVVTPRPPLSELR